MNDTNPMLTDPVMTGVRDECTRQLYRRLTNKEPKTFFNGYIVGLADMGALMVIDSTDQYYVEDIFEHLIDHLGSIIDKENLS